MVHVIILIGSHIALEFNIRYSFGVLKKEVDGIIKRFSKVNDFLIVVGELLVESRNVMVDIDHLVIKIVNTLLKNRSGGSSIYSGKTHDHLGAERSINNLVEGK